MATTWKPRTRRAIIRGLTTNLAWASCILAVVILTAQLVLIAFEGIQQIVAKSSHRTPAEVSKSWRMWLTDNRGDPISCYFFYCAFLALTTFCGRYFKAFSFWVLQLITVATLSFSLHQDRLLWENTWSKALGCICLSVLRILAGAFVVNLPSWSWSYMGFYEDRTIHPVSDKVIEIRMPEFEVRMRKPKAYFDRPDLALLDIRVILLRLAYSQLFEQLIRFACVRSKRWENSSAASYELVRLVTIVLGVQVLHLSVVRLTTHTVFFYNEKEDRVTPRFRIFRGLFRGETIHMQCVELDILLGRSEGNVAEETVKELAEVKVESREDAIKEDSCGKLEGSLKALHTERNTLNDMLDRGA